MKVFKIILGILMILGASSVLTMPIIGSVAICWFASAFMFILGVFAIINYIEAKNKEKIAKSSGKAYLKTGIGSLLFGIASVVLFFLTRTSIIGEALFLQIVSIIFGTWVLFDGISFISNGFSVKKIGANGWVAMIILGLFIALAGVFCIVNSFISLTAMGVMFGISMMMSGFALFLE